MKNRKEARGRGRGGKRGEAGGGGKQLEAGKKGGKRGKRGGGGSGEKWGEGNLRNFLIQRRF